MYTQAWYYIRQVPKLCRYLLFVNFPPITQKNIPVSANMRVLLNFHLSAEYDARYY